MAHGRELVEHILEKNFRSPYVYAELDRNAADL
jgi:hypothetical protein